MAKTPEMMNEKMIRHQRRIYEGFKDIAVEAPNMVVFSNRLDVDVGKLAPGNMQVDFDGKERMKGARSGNAGKKPVGD